MVRRRGRFSHKEHRKFVSLTSEGASLDQLATQFETSREMILQKAAELGVRLTSRTKSSSQTNKRGQVLVVIVKKN
jgi:hypothetical protein